MLISPSNALSIFSPQRKEGIRRVYLPRRLFVKSGVIVVVLAFEPLYVILQRKFWNRNELVKEPLPRSNLFFCSPDYSMKFAVNYTAPQGATAGAGDVNVLSGDIAYSLHRDLYLRYVFVEEEEVHECFG